MRTFIQLRDGIGFASLMTPKGEPDHTVTPDHTTVVEVFTDNPNQFIKMKYDLATNTWSDAPVKRFAEINQQGEIIEIRRTVFDHEIDDDTKLMTDDITSLHKWVDGAWVLNYIEPVEQPEPVIIEDAP